MTPCSDAAVNYSFGGIHGGTVTDNHVLRSNLGIKGDWSGWNYDLEGVVAHSWLDELYKGYLSEPQLISDIQNGTYNFINPSANSSAVLHALAPNIGVQATTDMDLAEFRVTHDFFELPGGTSQVGFSAEARHEAVNSPQINPDRQMNFGFAQAIGQRSIYSTSFEWDLPVLTTLEGDVSGRYDHYSDAGDTFNPKFGAKWQPIPEAALRGTFSTGFRAPGLAEDGNSFSEGFTSFTDTDPNFVAQHHGDAYTNAYTVGLDSIANPTIHPETSQSYTLGTILKPFDDIDFRATVDYYNILKTNVIWLVNNGAILGDAISGQPIPPGFTVTYDSPDPNYPNAPLRPILVQGEYANGVKILTDGIDVDISGSAEIVPGIKWATDLSGTKIFDYFFRFPGQTKVSFVGTEAPYNLSSSGGTPRIRGTWANTFTWDKLSVTGTLYYVSGMKLTAADVGITACGIIYPVATGQFCHQRDWYDFDLTARYSITDQIDITGGIKNLFDAKPPLDEINYAGGIALSNGLAANYNPTYNQAGIVGRFFMFGVSFKTE